MRAMYDAHSGNSTSTNSTARSRGDASRAMKYANGNAMITSVSVTANAMPIVRSATLRYVGSFQSVRKLSSVQLWMSCDVKTSTVQNDVTNSATSAAT